MGTRIASILLAALFFVSTVGFSIYVIIEANSEDDNQAPISEQQALNNLNNQQQEQQGDNMLAGTKLVNFEPQTEPVTELQIIDLEEGTGEVVKATDQITAHYTGAFVSDGTIFESSLDGGQPFTAGFDNLISGWGEGIPGMKIGGKRRLVIPAEKAYGASGSRSIPPNSDLVFDIEVLGVTE